MLMTHSMDWMKMTATEQDPNPPVPDAQPELLPVPDGETGVTEPRFSPSAIEIYNGCRRRFFYEYVLRADKRERPSPILCQASAIHEALDLYFGLRAEDRSEEVLHRALRSCWPRHRTPETFSGVEEEREWGRAALAMLSRFLDDFDGTVQPLRREGWVSTRLGNGVEVFGKVDRVDRLDGAIGVVDYKTGKLSVDEDDLPKLPATQVYIVAGEAEYGVEVARVRYLYLKEGVELRLDVEREDVVAAGEALTEITNEILAERDFAPNPGHACRWCPFVYGCADAFRVELDDLEVVESLPF